MNNIKNLAGGMLALASLVLGFMSFKAWNACAEIQKLIKPESFDPRQLKPILDSVLEANQHFALLTSGCAFVMLVSAFFLFDRKRLGER
jgi:hypothetical protein